MALNENITLHDVHAWAVGRVESAFELRRIHAADGDERGMARAAGQAGAFMELVRYLDSDLGSEVMDQWKQLIGADGQQDDE